MLKTINQCTKFQWIHLFLTKTLTFFENISHINHCLYNSDTLIQYAAPHLLNSGLTSLILALYFLLFLIWLHFSHVANIFSSSQHMF